MVDVVELTTNEAFSIDTTANIVAIVNLCQSLSVRDNDNNEIVVLGWGEIYTLGYNRGTFKLQNTATVIGRVYIVRQFIL